MSYVLSLDVGTSSLRASVYDAEGRPVPGLSVAAAHEPDTTPDGGVEMDADALVERVVACCEGVLARAGARAAAIRAVGVCTFWHSLLGVDAAGRAATPILLWADTRAVAEVDELKARLDTRAVHARTGCMQHTSYPPARLLWARRHRPEWLRRASRWMSPGEYLALRLFGRTACGVSMASGTGMYDHDAGAWDAEVTAAAEVDRAMLSLIVDASEPQRGLNAEFAARLPALRDVPWFPACGDGAASNVGSGCVGPDRLALMVGTSGALRLMDPGAGKETAPWGLWRYRWDRRRPLIGGALSNGGNLFAWLRETLRLPAEPDLEAALAAGLPDDHGLTVLPFLAGERCPGWRGDARAAIVGLSWATRPEDILRAGLEAVAYRFALIHELLRPAAAPGHQLIATGGALTASPAWTQMLADALGEPLVVSEESEASARGAALLALEGAGLLPDLRAAPARLGREYLPDPERHARYQEGRARQAALYRALLGDAPRAAAED
jgi:gluconokinase